MIAGAFERPEGPEDISPPPLVAKNQRSFESFLAAQVLQSKLGQDAAPQSSAAQTPHVTRSGGSVQKVKDTIEGETAEAKSDTDDAAIDCLMALSSTESSKRKASKLSTSAQPAPRRRLKMRMADTTALSAPTSNSTNAPPSAVPKSRLPVISSATALQLSLLAAAFKLYPVPSMEQLNAISARVELPGDRVQQWFESRKVLQDWVDQQPDLSTNDVKRMFYEVAEAH